MNGSPQPTRPISLRTARDATRAALDNERITRARVDALEAWIAAWTQLTFWQRVRWFFGR
jgi:hypothetical protein